ncbi:Hpt domain-containing protein [Friedmanniella luteola]|uniref:Hpt domain-containing protein n=1 Tax=Friedmanniella luteola TaxID=546871 RepID=A0A1H1XCC9_9ACTN|nr:Hpt domain-containing protein [Friedmanniella luteola]SDT06780.1 Hpt domain-containing protein [Friedmanniella luteola]
MVPEQPHPDPDDALRALMRTLAASAREANLARTAVLEEAQAALEAGRLDAEHREAAVAAAHQVVGSAGTFGRRRSSVLAADLEQWFRDGPPAGGDAAGRERVRAQLAELRTDLTAAGDHQDEV